MKTFMIILVLIISISLSSCKSNIEILTSNEYVSTCYIQRYPKVILNLESDGSFKYRFAYLEKDIFGSWYLLGDTLMLESDFFDEDFQRKMVTAVKYTEFSADKDAFLFKGMKLYRIDSLKGVDDKCYLNRIKKNN